MSIKSNNFRCVTECKVRGTGSPGTYTTLQPLSATLRVLTIPNVSDTVVCESTTDTFTNKTLTHTSNTVHTNYFKTTGADVLVVSAPPSTGQALVATSATTCTWQSLLTASMTLSASSLNFSATLTAPVASVTIDNSVYSRTRDNVSITIDITLVTDTSGPSDSLQLNVPSALLIECTAGTSTQVGLVTYTGGSSICSVYATAASPNVIFVNTLYKFMNSSTYTIRGQISYTTNSL